MMTESDAPTVACVVFAHADPDQVRRLISALSPLPVYLHVDARTTGAELAAMREGVPPERWVEPRLACDWAQWGLVAAEVNALRLALRTCQAEHFVVLTGSDYPLAPVSQLVEFLADHPGKSVAKYAPMPLPNWGSSGGLARLRYRHYGWRKRMIRIPVPRRLPAGIVPSGGGHQKILSRRHAELIVSLHDTRPDLVRFWRRTWSSDETFMQTLLLSPQFGVDWAAESIDHRPWVIAWNGVRRKSPPVLADEHFERLARARFPDDEQALPVFFARKFNSVDSAGLLDRIDAELRVPARAT